MIQSSPQLARLRLLHLADSALAIGSLAHSFGMETIVVEDGLTPQGLFAYLEGLLQEQLHLDAVFCRAAYQQGVSQGGLGELNDRMSALRLARESRDASLALGRRFAGLIHQMEGIDVSGGADMVHFALAFGYAGGVLDMNPDECVAAFLHQSIVGTISAAQRLMPLGQRNANQMAWDLKPAILDAVALSRLAPENAYCFAHLPEVASMRHPTLFTRLFIS